MLIDLIAPYFYKNKYLYGHLAFPVNRIEEEQDVALSRLLALIHGHKNYQQKQVKISTKKMIKMNSPQMLP